MRLSLIVLSVLVIAAGGIVGFAYSGLFDVSATANEPGLVRWLLQATRENSVRRRAADIAVPDISKGTLVASGARSFGEMCADCHGAPGRKPILGAKDMSPPPPDLTRTVAERTPAELYWVIKHGIRMTGMPAWGRTHSDTQLWELVAFLERLPELTPEGYTRLTERSGGDSHGHDHGGNAHTEPPAHSAGGHTH